MWSGGFEKIWLYGFSGFAGVWRFFCFGSLTLFLRVILDVFERQQLKIKPCRNLVACDIYPCLYQKITKAALKDTNITAYLHADA